MSSCWSAPWTNACTACSTCCFSVCAEVPSQFWSTCPSPGSPKKPPPGAECLGHAVGIQEQGVAGLHFQGERAPGGLGAHADRHPGAAQRPRPFAPVPALQQGRVVPRITVHQFAGGRLQDSQEERDEQAGAGLTQDVPVGRSQGQFRPLPVLEHEDTQHRSAQCHEQGGPHPLVGDIRDQESQPPIGQHEHVIEVPGGLAGGVDFRRKLPSAKLGQ